MKKLTQVFLLAVCAFFFAAQTNAQTNSDSGDARVTKALREISASYEMDETGDYTVTVKMPGSRVQTATIYSETFKSFGVELRSVGSVATVSRTRPSAETAYSLLEQNAIDPGAWGVVKTGDGKFELVNVVYIRADADAQTLGAALQTVTKAADAMRRRSAKK